MILRALLAVMALACAAPAGAEPEPIETIPVDPEAPAPAPDSEPTQLEDIVVTATKRSAALRDVPASIAALSGYRLEAMGASELRDFLRRIPGVGQIELQPDLGRISIRGIQTDHGGNTPDTTGIFIDDIPFNDPFLNWARPDLPPFDLEGVEVLKGPQGTLFGGSGLGGALRYKLADAVPGLWDFKTFAQYQDVTDGSPDRIGGAAANLPLGSSAALRLVGVRRLTGGTIDDLRNHETDTDRTANSSGRALLRWNAGASLSFQLKALQQRTRADDVPVAENTEGRLERERALRKSPSLTEVEVYGLNVDWSLPWADFVSSTSALTKLTDLSNANGERALGTEGTGQPVDAPVRAEVEGLVQEFRLVSPEDAYEPWEWLVGAFAHDYASLSTQRVFAPGEMAGQEAELLNFVADVTANEFALFGEASRTLGERWAVTLGARAYSVETAGTVVSSGAVILASGSAENRNDAAIRAQGLNPRFALSFDASEQVMSYLSIARGFRFGGIQIVGPSPASPDVPETYEPDSLWSYELGVRTQWLENSLQADAAAFYIDWRDPPVQTTTGGAVPLNVIDNVEGARSYGAELALRYLPPIKGLQLDLAAARTDARTTAPYTSSGGAVVPAGARLPGYADFQVVAEIRYGRALGAFAFDAALTHVIHGDGVSDIKQSLKTLDYQTTDLRFTLGHEAWIGLPRLSFGVTNLADERAVVSAFAVNANNYTTIYNRPRTVDVRLELAF